MSDISNAPRNPFAAPITTATPAAQPTPAVRVEGTKATPATTSYDGGPQGRFAEMQSAVERADPLKNFNLIMKRDANGVVNFYEKTIDPKTGAVIAGRLVSDEAGNAPADGNGDAPGPADVAEQKIKVGDIGLTETEIRDLMQHKAAEDSRKALVPQRPGDYKLELPAGLKLPGDIKYEFNTKDPLKGPALLAAQEWAHAKGMSQADFGDLLGLYAASQANEIALIHRAGAKERETLGITATPRVTAVSTWLRATFGDAAAQPFIATMVKASQVDVWEKVMSRYMNQGGAPFSGAGREPEKSGISDAEYQNMTYSQKMAYAQAATARGRR